MYHLSLHTNSQEDLRLIDLLAKRLAVETSNITTIPAPDGEYEKGLEGGIFQGLEQGLIEGIERGALNKAFELARNMKKSGFDKETIIKITHLISEDIEQL